MFVKMLKTLDRPSWKPPNYMFAPVWTTLYTGMGYASYLVYRDGFNGTAKIPLLLYSSQLILNWAWTPLFFHLHKLKWSLYEICALWTNVALCAIAFYRVNKVAGCLMVPYLGWLSLATGLTYYIYTNNKEISIKEE
ncbi:translocator protein isoform X2 [Daktulosphaira vitifoliae]|uniref:translocator protein isoform X2 n=1 Tax=Daktulosphaira vitifoliae TaxID=58002 RepID=UPI0021A9CAB7|nr:translocator protein isoform X2 [Daktulosphaira vitifoliae]